MSEQQVNTSTQQIVDTPENWNKASRGYAEKVAPYLMESLNMEQLSQHIPDSLCSSSQEYRRFVGWK